MKTVELYARVRHAVLIEGISERTAADRFGINARTVSKMLKFSVPPGYVRTKPPFRPKLDEFTGVIDAILAADKARPKKQHHTSKRIFERLRDEHGFTGRITIVKDYVADWRQRTQEMFVPLVHPPGHAQADFGEAMGVIGGVERKIHFFAMDLPHSDAIFVVGYPAETTEAFCDGHVRAFAFFEGVPQSILYDNTKIAVARILGGGKALKLPTFLREYDKVAQLCAAEGVDHPRYLMRLAEMEMIDRARRMVERRIKAARFPTVKSLDSFDFLALPSLNKMSVLELARSDYIGRRENIIAVGNSGTGKSHIALGLGLAAYQKGLSVGFITVT